jgi:hypothetical protein
MTEAAVSCAGTTDDPEVRYAELRAAGRPAWRCSVQSVNRGHGYCVHSSRVVEHLVRFGKTWFPSMPAG